MIVRHLPENIPIANKDDLILQLTAQRQHVLPLADRPVAINAAMVRPKKNSTIGEWVTLFNRTEDDVSVEGWSLRDTKGRSIDLKGSIAPAGTMRVATEALGKIRLTDTGGNLILRDSDGQQVDHVSWTGSAIKKVARGTAYQFEVGQ